MLAVNQENEHLMEDYERLASDVSDPPPLPSPGGPARAERSGPLSLPWPKAFDTCRGESKDGSEAF